MSTVAEKNETTNSVAENLPRQSTEKYLLPVVNIYETTDGYTLEADLPGVGKDGVEISTEANTLTILGHRERAENAGEQLYRESAAAGYRRVFELDPAIDAARISAKMDHGVLTVTLPKSESVKPRKITVTG
jgi:HSP20 family protein